MAVSWLGTHHHAAISSLHSRGRLYGRRQVRLSRRQRLAAVAQPPPQLASRHVGRHKGGEHLQAGRQVRQRGVKAVPRR